MAEPVGNRISQPLTLVQGDPGRTVIESRRRFESLYLAESIGCRDDGEIDCPGKQGVDTVVFNVSEDYLHLDLVVILEFTEKLIIEAERITH